eukprot:2680132-Pyramimonas_sp.AAC.1
MVSLLCEDGQGSSSFGAAWRAVRGEPTALHFFDRSQDGEARWRPAEGAFESRPIGPVGARAAG